MGGENRWPQAVRRLEALTGVEAPGDLDILLARAHREMGNNEKAASLSNAALRNSMLSKNRARIVNAYEIFKDSCGDEKLEAHDRLVIARSFLEYGKTRRAREILAQGLQQFPGNPEEDLMVHSLADICQQEGRPAAARNILEFFVRTYPNSKLRESAQWTIDAGRRAV